MFRNCGEFIEINSDLLATYLFNDLSKTFTNVLQITKFCKNYKKFFNARAGKPRAACRYSFLIFTDFQWKNSRSADVQTFFIFAHQCFVEAIWTHTFQKGGDCVRKVEYLWCRLGLYGKIYFGVIESK